MTTAAVWHPWYAEFVLSLGNRVRRALRAPLSSGLVLLALAGLVALLTLGLRQVEGDRIGFIIHLLLAQPLVLVALFAVFGYVGVRGATQALAGEWRYGWWGAMPVSDAVVRRSLRLAAVVFASLMIVLTFALFAIIASIAPHWYTWFRPATTYSSAGLLLGAAVGYVGAGRLRAPEQKAVRAISGAQPMFRLPFLGGGALPWLGLWQRRDALRRWRGAGFRGAFTVVALAVPATMAPVTLIGLFALVLGVAWLGIVLRSTADVAAHAGTLLAATPYRRIDLAAATARYPLWAWLVASFLATAGLALQDASRAFVLAGAPVLAYVVALCLALAWRYADRPALGRARYAAEPLASLALFLLFGPWSLLVPAILLLRHLQVALSRR